MIPSYLSVRISHENGVNYIDVFAMTDRSYRAVVYEESNDVNDYEVDIYNHTGTDLELLEKILHGRNMSREN